MKTKKIFKYLLLIGLLLIPIYIFLIIQYGSIDILGTINTKYHKIENSSDRIIETKHFNIRAAKDWIHIYGGYGCGGYYGTFQTWDGAIHYEYGMFAPEYDGIYDVSQYEIENRQINNFRINIARNKNNETGICIPVQNGMENQLTFYIDDSVTKNFNELIKGIEDIEFK